MLWSLSPQNPTGTGPIFGLSLDSFGSVITQLLTPLPFPPIHVQADGNGDYAFFVQLGAGNTPIPVDVVALSFHSALGVTDTSPVLFTTLMF